MNIIVTGAGGYIGTVLCKKLALNGHNVTAVDRYFFGKNKLFDSPRIQRYNADVRDLYRTLPQGHFDAMIDLAAISNDPAGEQFNVETTEINHVARSKNAYAAKAAGIKRYILPSSASIYGFNEEVVDETSPTNPLTTYAKANLAAENDILPLADDDFAVAVLRQSTVFGVSPRQRLDLAINIMTFNAYTSGEIMLGGDGKQYRPFVHVQDTTDLMMDLATVIDTSQFNGEIFNVGDEMNNLTIREVAEQIQTFFESKDRKITTHFDGPLDHRNYRLSFEKAKKVLGWQPKYSVSDGIEELFESMQTGTFLHDDTTQTLPWYNKLEKYNEIFNDVNSSNEYVLRRMK